ncbi:MAG: hypothetical protein IPG93_22865 [Burkholderiales bacterium]|nr:hypothetical protein [Burkholderiales bacterium]
MALLIHAHGASERDRLRGAAAAWSVFDQAGVTASACAWAVFQRDRATAREQPAAHIADAHPLSENIVRLATIWDLAQDAGVAACCSAMASVPADACMELPQADFLAGL